MIEILIVEDDNALSQGIALSLRDNDRRLTQCPTLAAAREAMAGFSYDLLILDIGLPDGDGLNSVSYTHLDVYKRQDLLPAVHKVLAKYRNQWRMFLDVE